MLRILKRKSFISRHSVFLKHACVNGPTSSQWSTAIIFRGYCKQSGGEGDDNGNNAKGRPPDSSITRGTTQSDNEPSAIEKSAKEASTKGGVEASTSSKLTRPTTDTGVIRRPYNDIMGPIKNKQRGIFPRWMKENFPGFRDELGQTMVNNLEEDIHKALVYRRDQWNNRVDVPGRIEHLVIGGGIVGMATAYWLRKMWGSMDVGVVERDPSYLTGSTVTSIGGIRTQFSLPENIKQSLFTAEFMKDLKEHLTVLNIHPPDVHFTPASCLLLASEESVESMQENHKVQIENKVRVELLDKDQLIQRFPWLNVEDIALGSYGLENEGFFDQNLLLAALKAKCFEMGVQFIHGEVVGFGTKDIQTTLIEPGKPLDKMLEFCMIRSTNGEEWRTKAYHFYNCAGPKAGHVGKLAGIGIGDGVLSVPIPVEPRKRYLYAIQCSDGPGLDTPFLVDNSGVSLRREGLGGNYICSATPPHDYEGDASSFFYETVHNALQHRIPAFANLEVTNSWSGEYDYNTLDQNLIIGNHPLYLNFFMACGSSGLGNQNGVAVGKSLAELSHFFEDKLNLVERLSFDRVLYDEPVYESNIV